MRRGVKKNLMVMLGVFMMLYVLINVTGGRHRHSLSQSRLELLQAIRNKDGQGAPRKFKWAPHQPLVVESHPNKELVYSDCVPLPEAPIRRAKICIYPRKFDRRQSEFLKQGRLTDKDLIKQMDKALRADHNMQLVDLGANIGEYTLHAASWGSKVLAVEMYPDNIKHLQTSLATSGLSNYVTLVNNALYSDHRQMTAQYIRAYLGDRYLHIPKPNCQHWGMTEENIAADQVNSICMDDLLPLLTHKRVFLRLNLDGLEPVALQCAFKFFDQADVRVVQMRWIDKTQEEMDVLNEFMKLEWGFKASREALQYIPANTNIPTTFKGYVYWIKVNDGEVEENEEEEEEEEQQPEKKEKKLEEPVEAEGEGEEEEEEEEGEEEKKDVGGVKGKSGQKQEGGEKEEEEEEEEESEEESSDKKKKLIKKKEKVLKVKKEKVKKEKVKKKAGGQIDLMKMKKKKLALAELRERG